MQTGAVSARQAVRNAAERLERAGVPEPVASAEILLSELLDVRRGDLAFQDESLTVEQADRYAAWIERRIRREPVQRILGYAYFRNLRLDLDESALIPRSDTESVVDAALNAIDRRGGVARVLDLGTGSGAIAVSIAQEKPLCEVYATDISEAALETARRNAERAGVTVQLHRADMAEGLEDLAGRVDVLVSNPPYVPTGDLPDLAPEVRDWDPATALDGGPDGLLYYRRIFAETRDLFASDADVVLEVGDGQSEAVLELGSRAGFAPIGVHSDLGGTSRAVLLRRELENEISIPGFRVNTASVTEAAEALRAGKAVLIPTETVVGLVASEAGLSRIQEMKRREPGKAVALICSSPAEAFALARNAPPLAEKLAQIYWPGPLTLVLDAPEGGTVGVRVPDHPAVQNLLAAFGGPLYATSANLSGEPAPASLDDVDSRVSGEVDVTLAGEPGSGEASAVVDLSGGRIELLRASPQLTEERLWRLAASSAHS